MLAPSDFADFFREVHGYDPFPWQARLLYQLAEQGGPWPATLDLPTAAGKTASIDIAVFHLALEADRGVSRRAPVRIAFVVDRRLVVDDAFARAKRLAVALARPTGRVAERVAQRLRILAGDDGPPLIVRSLRGGLPREDGWARTPSQPTVLCSTVDQVGSRLLFRGYGVSDSMKPVHAGLLGSDCLILLDEAHLAEPFRQTLRWVQVYQGEKWRESPRLAPWGVALLTATPGVDTQNPFALLDDDRAHSVLSRRLEASKRARLVLVARAKRASDDAPQQNGAESESAAANLFRRTTVVVTEIRAALKHFENPENGVDVPAIGVVVNRVARARSVFQQLRKELADTIAAGKLDEPILMIGPARAIDRATLADRLEPIRTRMATEENARTLPKPLIIVSTQCIEAGVDIDLDALITELAPLDALRQRFGRLNRAGREIVPYAGVIAMQADISPKYVDPVYGCALKPAWEALDEAKANGTVEFGIAAFGVRMTAAAIAPKPDAPILLPAHLDLLSQTAPVPAADPDVALYLHGADHRPDAITVVWRADIDADAARDEETRRLLTLAPPRAAEAIDLPVWAVRCWLERRQSSPADDLADVAGAEPEEVRSRSGKRGRPGFRWKGDDERSQWIAPADLRPGDTLVVPASYGGVDRFGWNPMPLNASSLGIEDGHATDVGREAAAPFSGRRFAVRIAPELLGTSVTGDSLADALADAVSRRWQDLSAAVLALPVPQWVRDDLALLRRARARKVVPYLDAYGSDDEGRPRGVVFVALRGLEGGASEEDDAPNATEDDTSGSMPGFGLELEQHCMDVRDMARRLATLSGLTEERVADLALSGYLHDLGKADQRFQAWLHYGDPLGLDLDAPEQRLAKSGRPLPGVARARSGLPAHWRHEALSVRLALEHPDFVKANDPALVLWLLGAHHGYGRPLFPHSDPSETAPNVGPQSLAFDWRGLDWPSLFTQLKARYGVWELARMEAILRLADHRASEMRAREVNSR